MAYNVFGQMCVPKLVLFLQMGHFEELYSPMSLLNSMATCLHLLLILAVRTPLPCTKVLLFLLDCFIEALFPD